MERWKGVCGDPPILKALLEQGFTTPTEVQQRAIPEVLRGNDVIGAAETVRNICMNPEYFSYVSIVVLNCFDRRLAFIKSHELDCFSDRLQYKMHPSL